MNSHGWQLLYQTIRQAASVLPRPRRRPRYSDTLIVAMFFWAVWNDRPMSWACDRSHYHGPFRPPRLPSVSQFSRRLRSDRTEQVLDGVFRRLAETDRITRLCCLDGRPLPVGSCSKDREARPGRVYGGFSRGYKLHAMITADYRVLTWCVTALNVSEQTAAMALIETVPVLGLVLADGNYDGGPVYDAVAAKGGQLLTPLSDNAGQGHRQQSPHRLSAIDLYRDWGRYVYPERIRVEQGLAHMATFGGGLGPLPTWVRTLERVRRWVGAKMILYHVRRRVRRQETLHAA
jgi:hypothetical protein